MEPQPNFAYHVHKASKQPAEKIVGNMQTMSGQHAGIIQTSTPRLHEQTYSTPCRKCVDKVHATCKHHVDEKSSKPRQNVDNVQTQCAMLAKTTRGQCGDTHTSSGEQTQDKMWNNINKAKTQRELMENCQCEKSIFLQYNDTKKRDSAANRQKLM